ncbi:MAG: TonB-dependent receptor, partial [Pseudomonadales bacterium]
MRSNIVSFHLLLLFAVATTGLAPVFCPLHAAENQAALQLEEVIVSARKREENLQQAPISATALTASMLEDAALPDLSSIEAMTPNLSFTVGSDGSSSSLQAFIRGVGQFDFALTTDPGVGVYIDGVYLARTIGANLEFADIERIEVLRGPQGTLFGKNTIGGAINVVSKVPSGDTNFSLHGTVGRFDYVGTNAYVEFPLVKDKLSASISFLSKNSDGWQKRPGDDAGNDDMLGGRAHLYWTPVDTFSSHLIVDAIDQDQQVYPRVLERFDPNQVFPSFYNGFVAPCCTQTSDIDRSNVPPETDHDKLESYGLSWTNSFDLGGLTLKSISGYRNMDSDTLRDSDNDPLDYFSVRAVFDHEQFSQEFLLNGLAFNEKLNWLVGAYYFNEDGEHLTDVTVAEGLFEVLSALPLSVTDDGTPTGTPLQF